MVSLLIAVLVAILVIYAFRLLPIADSGVRNVGTIIVAIVAIIIIARYAGAL